MASLSLDVLAEATRRRCGDEAYFSPELMAALGLLLGEVSPQGLEPEGRRLLQSEVLRVLEQSNYSFAFRERNITPWPSEPLVLVITGVPRSGTTLLQYLLCDTGQFAFVPFWQALSPFAGPGMLSGRESGRGLARTHLRFMDAASPELRRLHPMNVDDPEECIGLLQLTGWSERFAISLNVPEYTRQYLTKDRGTVYLRYRSLLQSLMPTATRLLLKAPTHLGHLAEMQRVFPALRIVVLHRPLEEMCRSFSRLVKAARRPFYGDARADVWPLWREYWDYSLAGRSCAKSPPKRPQSVTGYRTESD